MDSSVQDHCLPALQVPAIRLPAHLAVSVSFYLVYGPFVMG